MSATAKKLCVSCVKREAVKRVGNRHLCQQCVDKRNAAIKRVSKL
jgi:hypothetical protein